MKVPASAYPIISRGRGISGRNSECPLSQVRLDPCFPLIHTHTLSLFFCFSPFPCHDRAVADTGSQLPPRRTPRRTWRHPRRARRCDSAWPPSYEPRGGRGADCTQRGRHPSRRRRRRARPRSRAPRRPPRRPSGAGDSTRLPGSRAHTDARSVGAPGPRSSSVRCASSSSATSAPSA